MSIDEALRNQQTIIGSGNYATVYAVTARTDKTQVDDQRRSVVLKIIQPRSKSTVGAMHTCFTSEVNAIRVLNAAADYVGFSLVPEIYDWRRDNARMIISLQQLDTTLTEWIGSDSISTVEVHRELPSIVYQIALSLNVLGCMNISHNDVFGRNIMLLRVNDGFTPPSYRDPEDASVSAFKPCRYTVRLIDFGICSHAGSGASFGIMSTTERHRQFNHTHVAGIDMHVHPMRWQARDTSTRNLLDWYCFVIALREVNKGLRSRRLTQDDMYVGALADGLKQRLDGHRDSLNTAAVLCPSASMATCVVRSDYIQCFAVNHDTIMSSNENVFTIARVRQTVSSLSRDASPTAPQ